jgi:hypothetical protein
MGGKRGMHFIVEALETRALLAFVADLTPISALSGDPASAVIKVKFIHNGTEAIVSGILSNISNPSAVVLRLPSTTLMSPPVTTTTMTTTPPGSSSTVTATVNTVTTSMNAQTVAVLLKPGAGSGPFRHVPFKGTINQSSLIGALTGQPFRQLRTDMRDGLVSAVVTTNNGVDPMTDVQPGNAQSGEIKGPFVPTGPSPWVAALVQSIDQGLVTTLANRAS